MKPQPLMRASRAEAGVLAIAALVELFGSALASLGTLPLSAFGGLHVLVVLALLAAVLVWERNEGSSTALQLGLWSTATGGFFGAAAVLWLTAGRACPDDRLERWFGEFMPQVSPEPASVLSEGILDSRTRASLAGPGVSFEAVLLGGDTRKQQALLAHLASARDPDYGRFLHAALRSPEPLLRAQAAAVAARMRAKPPVGSADSTAPDVAVASRP